MSKPCLYNMICNLRRLLKSTLPALHINVYLWAYILRFLRMRVFLLDKTILIKSAVKWFLYSFYYFSSLKSSKRVYMKSFLNYHLKLCTDFFLSLYLSIEQFTFRWIPATMYPAPVAAITVELDPVLNCGKSRGIKRGPLNWFISNWHLLKVVKGYLPIA